MEDNLMALWPEGVPADLVETRWSEARRAWPTIRLSAAEFFRFVAERLPEDLPPADGAAALFWPELYLTCACALGDSPACALLDARYVSRAVPALKRMGLGQAQIDDVRQTLLRRLVVRESAAPARIVAYGGRGDLGRWIRINAVRVAIRLGQSRARERPEEDAVLARRASIRPDAEVGAVVRSCRELFRESFREGLAQMEARARNILKQHYLDGLTLDDLARLHGTHRATVARWLAAARGALRELTNRALMSRVRGPIEDCESVIRKVQSQLEMTFASLFRGSPA